MQRCKRYSNEALHVVIDVLLYFASNRFMRKFAIEKYGLRYPGKQLALVAATEAASLLEREHYTTKIEEGPDFVLLKVERP